MTSRPNHHTLRTDIHKGDVMFASFAKTASQSIRCAVLLGGVSIFITGCSDAGSSDAQLDNKAAASLGDSTQNDASTASYLSRPPEDDVIYFMLPDRFENGDSTNDTGGFSGDKLGHGYDPTDKAFYHGGDLKGLTARLDYIKGMGASAIWLGPIYKNKPVQGAPGQESSGYHGYWITDFTSVDPHLGTNAELKTFVDAAHARDMKVYLDIITNHTADVISYRECYDPNYTGNDKVEGPCTYRSVANYPFTTRGDVDGPAINDGFMGDAGEHQTVENFAKLTNPNYAYTPYIPAGEENSKTPAWLNDLKYYHNRGETTFTGEDSLYGDFSGLDDLMTEHPFVVEGMVDIFKDWVTDYRMDGFRIDTTRHVNPEFWRQFLPALKTHAAAEGIPNFYMFGEVYDPDPGALARFTRVDGFDQVLDFGFQSAVFDAVSGNEPAVRLDRFLRADALYADATKSGRTQPTFLGNHDMGRFSGLLKEALKEISQDELLARTKLGHELLLTMRGVPVIYSGSEQGFVSDGGDQLARENMFPSKVALYNDNDLIGTDATTAQSNFDTDHILYRTISDLSAVRRSLPALSRGETVVRLAETDGGLFAFSRFDPTTNKEVIVLANLDETARTVNVRMDAGTQSLTQVYGPETSHRVPTTGTLSAKLPAFSLVVLAGDQPALRP